MVGFYIILTALVHIPKIQSYIADVVETALCDVLGTKIEIERVELGLFNRVIVDGICIEDQTGKQMLKAARVSARFDLMSLLNGRISITSAQLFGLNADLYKKTEKSPLNCQFLLDSLASEDTTGTNTNIHIASLVIRNGSIKYNQLDTPKPHSGFSPQHLDIRNLSSHILIYQISDDVIDAQLKTLSFNEQCGLGVEKLSFNIDYKKQQQIRLENFALRTNNSTIKIPIVSLINNDESPNNYLLTKIKGTIDASRISCKDIQFFVSRDLSEFSPFTLRMEFAGTGAKLRGHTKIDNTDHSFSMSNSFLLHNLLSDSTSLKELPKNFQWELNDFNVLLAESFNRRICKTFEITDNIANAGDITITSKAQGTLNSIKSQIGISTKNVGTISIEANYANQNARINAGLEEVNIGNLLSSPDFGSISANVEGDIKLNDKKYETSDITVDIKDLAFKEYHYNNIKGHLEHKSLHNNDLCNIIIESSDPNMDVGVYGDIVLARKAVQKSNVKINARNIEPKSLNLTDEWGNASFSFDLSSTFSGSNIEDLTGNAVVSNFIMNGAHKSITEHLPTCYLPELQLNIDKFQDERSINLRSNFCNANINGRFNISTLLYSMSNIVKAYLPSAIGVSERIKTQNDLRFNVILNSSELIHRLTGLDLDVNKQVQLSGYINDKVNDANVYFTAPHFKYNDITLDDTKMLVWKTGNSLRASLTGNISKGDNVLNVNLNSKASNDNLATSVQWNNLKGDKFAGKLNTTLQANTASNDMKSAVLSIEPSDIQLGDTIWQLHSNNITFTENRINVDNFALENTHQHIFINGTASNHPQDSLMVDLKNVNIEYIMNLVNFHSVEFAGFATGKVVGKNLFDTPSASAQLEVDKFKFEEGNLGTLYLDAVLNNESNQIDIDAVAKDTVSYLGIKGFVSPQREDLELQLDLQDTRLEFLKSYCYSFMDNIMMKATGDLKVYGPFSYINLTGDVIANGSVFLKSLNCTYVLPGDAVKFIPDDILIQNQPIMDKHGNTALISGGLHHKHLTQMTFDFDIDAHNFLAYETTDFGTDVFYGTAFMTGNCNIKGRSARIDINVTGNVEPGSIVVYDSTTPESVSSQDFINWHSMNSHTNDTVENVSNAPSDSEDIGTNIYLNFFVNVSDASTLKIIMDKNTGDYINFYGNGAINAKYYNKGNFNLYGNYAINKGVYHMTIQNILRHNFDFQPGSEINFNGNPDMAKLNLKAMYTLNSVPLSDLSIGQSFSKNNVRVDCIMSIGGTVGSPSVEFDIDLPTVNSDAKQMIYSLINSEEEMRQQVLYLLAVHRFYAQGANNAITQDVEGNRTNMAMQSLLSGTLSQQLGNALGSVLNSTKWTIGANISPGNEGFNNAEYEGIFSGSLLSNRLLINGQIGYRDNAATSTQGFIGDFDIRYLLVPNGDFSVRVYNQANDRYFTRNSLNTQGLGLVLKTDFNSWRSLFYRNKKKQTSPSK